VSPVAGTNSGTITVTATSNNTSTSSRSGTITITGNGITRTVSVTQNAATSTQPPTITTTATTNITQTTAQLNGTVNANGLSTVYYFHGGPTTGQLYDTPSQSAGLGTSTIAVIQSLTNLLPNTSYTFHIVATNSAGTSYGNDLTFTTTSASQAPTVTTTTTTNITQTTAQLNGTVNPNGLSTVYYFHGGPTTGQLYDTPSQNTGSGTSTIAVIQSLTNLLPNTSYTFHIVATNSAGTSYGNDLTFTTTSASQVPTVTTTATTNITQTSAQLNGTVNPNGLSTVYYFHGGPTTGQLYDTPSQSAGSGTSTIAVIQSLTNLLSNMSYTFHIVATNSAGTSYGNDLTFTTTSASQAPTVTTTITTNITQTSAQLNGTVNPNGLSTVYYFEYGTTNSYGTITSPVNAGSGTSNVSVNSSISGLSPNTTYHFRVDAINNQGTTYGNDISFTTSQGQNSYTISCTPNPTNGGTTSGSGTYNSGNSVTVTATPNSGYTFSNWTENGAVVSTSSSYTFTISGNRNLIANFSTSSTPTITVSTTSLSDFGTIQVGSNSSQQTYTVSGSNLTSNITITAPSGFIVSTSSNSGFGSTVPLIQSGGSVSNTTIYTIFSPTNAGFQSGNIVHTSPGAATANVSVSGIGSQTCTPVTIATQPQNQSVNSGSIATFSVSVNGTGPFSYFWYKNGVFQTNTTNTSSSTNSYTTLTLTSINSGDYYYCLITNCSSTYEAQSNNAYVTVNNSTQTVTYAGKTYNTVQIGSQYWLQENLDVGTMILGDGYQSDNGIIEKYCYNDDPNNCTTYGGLYQWAEAVQYKNGVTNSTSPNPAFTGNIQGICPSGWHIPTQTESNILVAQVNSDGNALKAAGQGTGNGTGTNTSGFSMLLAGTYYYYNGGFGALGIFTNFWSSTEYDASHSIALYLYSEKNNIDVGFIDKGYGFSIRCIMDESGTGVESNNGKGLPTDYSITQNYPNPFNPSTIINYSVPKAGFVTIKVYDVLGREVVKLVNENKPVGNYSIKFNGNNLPSGIYFYRMESGSFFQTKKLLLVK
jgi:uncharacterized protein (TIGR02145 family)